MTERNKGTGIDDDSAANSAKLPVSPGQSRLTSHDPGRSPLSILQRHWGYAQFRPMQEDIILSVLGGKDTLALMPTGGGKSLCYQVPAMAMDGVCLVISPLIALMKDQVESLRRRNITAYAIFSGMSRKEVMQTLQVVAESNCKFLYVSPERLETSLFKEWLPGLGISLIAVDEAHCISQWGYDFRPPYLRIAALRDELRGVPVLALTASATPDVQEDICRRLTPANAVSAKVDDNWKIFRQSFLRPNLSYSNFEVDVKVPKIVDILKKVPGTGIVYCKSRRRTKEISELLRMHNIQADYYHAGLAQEERAKKQEQWIDDKTRVIVCTNAFGMGIDKPDVRVVVHADVPDCLENYYQEAGRAGRDGKKAYAVLLYQPGELEALQKMTETRFPSLETIRETYQAVYNFLQVPAGGGVGEYFKFDMKSFVQKFKLDPSQTLYALQALEQDGWLTINEQVFSPSKLSFNCTKDFLYRFEREQPALEPLVKSLLRAYEGIFDQSCFISESTLAYLLRQDEEKIKQDLQKLHHYRLVIYEPRSDDPQVYLHRSRVPANELHFKMDAYLERKERFRARVAKMLEYTEDKARCRSQITASYFGDDNTEPCGICDNCLQKKNPRIEKKEFDEIKNAIFSSLKEKPLPANELLQALNQFPKEKTWKVIDHLQGEQQLKINKEGNLTL